MFGIKKMGKNRDADPRGPQVDLHMAPSGDPNSPYELSPEKPFGYTPPMRHNQALRAWHAFHYGEEPLPGRLYPSRILRTYGRVASDVIDPVGRG